MHVRQRKPPALPHFSNGDASAHENLIALRHTLIYLRAHLGYPGAWHPALE
jgi:hypothetical protein